MKNFQMDYVKSYILMWICYGVGILLIVATMSFDIFWPCCVGVAVILAGLLQTLFFFRCPACGKLLNIRGGLPHYCPECGEFLR